MNKPKVYLAGGLQSNWRERVISECKGRFTFFNPKEHGLEGEDPNYYTQWDIYHVKECNILFGFMERENKSGYGLSLEIGYAKAAGKLIILIDEKSDYDSWFKSKFSIVHASSAITFKDLNEGILYLKSFGNNKAIIND